VIIIHSILEAAYYVIGFMQILIFVYVILSWIPQARNSRWGYMLSVFVEPIISPVRNLLGRIETLRMLPIDLSPIATWFLLGILQSIIGMLLQYI
jgi:YggT family protein